MHAAPRIDAHIHFWGPSELNAYEWMTKDMSAIRRPFGPEDLRPHLEAHAVGHIILVQTYSSTKETEKLLELAGRLDLVSGVVGWADLTDPGFPDVIEALRARSDGHYLVGLRHQVHDEADPEWLLRGDVRRGLAALQHAGLPYDLLVRTRELPSALDTCRALPEMPFVIDHIGKPPIAAAELEPWAERMGRFASLEHVSCKLSGVVTEADWQRWETQDLMPYLERVVDWFGEDRLIYGSDWPVCTLAGSYDDVIEVAEWAVRGLDQDGVERIFRRNAAAFYGLPDPA
ncbi:MAG: amidohydrolase family protein [Actinomycetota bacterium]|nr:amidohydrolase family protein [Actinomycetota bacterium]